MAITPPPSTPVQRSLNIPPPIGGWNTKQPISNMDPIYAPDILNFYPNDGTVSVRNGSRIFCNPGVVGAFGRGLFPYTRSNGTQWQIALSSVAGQYYPYSINTAATATDISGGVSVGGPIATCQFKDRIFLKSFVNTHDVYHWTGTGNIALSGFTGPSGDDKALCYPHTYKNRIYFLATGTASVWFGADAAVTGALSQYDYSGFLPNGGILMFGGGLSPNINNLRDEYYVVISQNGDVVLYQGNNPSDTTWALVGVYNVGAPLGNQSFIRYQNDIIVITAGGLVSLMAVINGTPLENAYLTDNIQSAYRSYTESIVNNNEGNGAFGIYSQDYNQILVSLPGVGAPPQIVFNTINKAWTKFTGWNAIGFINSNKRLYYLDITNVIMEANTGDYDEDPQIPLEPLARTILLRHAFNYMGNPAVRKKPVQAVPTVYQSEGLSITLNCDVDFTNDTATSTETDTSKGTSYQIYQPKCGLVADSGSAISIRIDGTVFTKKFRLEATKVYWNEGTDY